MQKCILLHNHHYCVSAKIYHNFNIVCFFQPCPLPSNCCVVSFVVHQNTSAELLTWHRLKYKKWFITMFSVCFIAFSWSATTNCCWDTWSLLWKTFWIAHKSNLTWRLDRFTTLCCVCFVAFNRPSHPYGICNMSLLFWCVFEKKRDLFTSVKERIKIDILEKPLIIQCLLYIHVISCFNKVLFKAEKIFPRIKPWISSWSLVNLPIQIDKFKFF